MQFSIGQGLSVRISMERIIKRKVKQCPYQSKIAMAYPHTVNASPLALSILIIHPTTSNLFFPTSWLRSFIPFSTPQTCWSRIPSYYQKIHSKRSWYSERSFASASLSAIYLQSKRFRLCVSISTRYLHTPSYLSEKQCGEFDRCSGQHPSHQVQAREACNQVWIEFQ